MGGKLNARKVATASAGKHADGGGLYLFVDGQGDRRWFFLFSWRGRRPEMSLGHARDVSLADAREAAASARKLVRSGINPIELRKATASKAETPTFGQIADELFESKLSEWRNDKHREQWRIALVKGAKALRGMPVDAIDTEAVLAVLKPLWNDKSETASRLRGRIEAVLDAAKAKGHRSGENPARWRGHLSHLLPKRQKLARGNHAAMPYADVPAFLAKLREQENVGAWALEFTILTATRSGEVYGAQWPEIDMKAKVWTIPAERTKAGREHRVPLCDRAMAILKRLEEAKTCEFVFPSPHGQKKLSHVAMAKAMRRAGADNATVHGFRSSFRDWAGNETHFPREIAEAALAHIVGDKAEQAYRRSDALEKRRALMQAWADYIEPKQAGGADVLAFKKTAGKAN